MKRASRFFIAALLAALLLLPCVWALAAGPLDEIKSYVVTVDVRRDGTMDIRYHVDWQVLDDTSEGPLTWVKIGIANSHADSIEAISPNIRKIGYLGEGGSYVRVDLDRAYNAGETVSFDFSLHQSYMYTLDNAAGTCSYSFVPGWFEEIRVDSCKVLWNKANVSSSNATGAQDDYLTWEATSLEPGQMLSVNVSYPGGALDTLESMQVVQGSDHGSSAGEVIIPLLVFGGIVGMAIYGISKNRYRGGFGGGTYHGTTYHGCACASSCACACACACAGGGRAGCSAKNFYGAGVQTDALHKRLNPDTGK